MLNDFLKNKIKDEALLNKPNEACGLIFKSGELLDVYPCKNISSDKQEHFELNPFDYLKVTKLGKIVGMYHSQKDTAPSVLDYVISSGHNIYSIVYSWENDIFTEINENINKYIKYIGINFEFGQNDCYELIRIFYKNEFNIELKNYIRHENSFEPEDNIIEKNYLYEGFEKINLQEIKFGDCIVFGLLKNCWHIGIYMDNGLFLHHPRNKYSTVEKLTDIWKDKILFCVRHKNLNIKNNE